MGIFEEIQKNLDMEFFLDRESIPYKLTHGVSGMQLSIKTCPNPACRDDRWRVYFGVDTGQGNCFVCGKGFSKSTFIRDYLGGEWRDVLKEIGAILREQGWRPVRKAMVATTDSNVVLPLSEPIPDASGKNLDYLEKRGFDASISAYFKLRMCHFGWWKYLDPDQGSQKTQDFSNRVIIPVYDMDGELKTFQGRDITGTSDRKYLFPKLLPGTGRYLLNAHNATATDHVVMGEGIFDVAAMTVAFDQDVSMRHLVPIGSFGKHLSYGSPDADDQLGRFNALKRRGIKTVTIMWDGEKKALEAALAAAKMLTAAGLVTRVALLPAGNDPNEVPPQIVRDAFHQASVWTPSFDITMRLRNPYA